MIEPEQNQAIPDTSEQNQPESVRGTSAVTLNQREKLVEEMRRECKAQLKVVRQSRIDSVDEKFDPQLVAAANTLAKSIAVLSAEGRQLDKHREATVANIDVETEDRMVLEFLAEISPARRAAFRNYLSDSDEADQLLGHG